MIDNFGEVIRKIRIEQGFGLNEFAKILDVSPGYLSNLETGKTNTIQLSILKKIQGKLHILPINEEIINSPISFRLHKLEHQLIDSYEVDRQMTELLIHQIESTIKWIKENTSQ
ncbi:helix-turn-helix transcriptional regulator [Neobacillus sp. PS3-40]|uniref:helix-turn-helix domain-containing protein n=1 Tax=Neobacillus sp. PS3-40 TaxID=3070679 RepID=UPI0027E05C58|nr:helix-turn-helix transcriptional regulator [Neobacillus sp. PS3-40]WML45410.1 helix-turn-helix transcriptional regulator [Neobacillus sp. PS3-40]